MGINQDIAGIEVGNIALAEIEQAFLFRLEGQRCQVERTHRVLDAPIGREEQDPFAIDLEKVRAFQVEVLLRARTAIEDAAIAPVDQCAVLRFEEQHIGVVDGISRQHHEGAPLFHKQEWIAPLIFEGWPTIGIEGQDLDWPGGAAR